MAGPTALGATGQWDESSCSTAEEARPKGEGGSDRLGEPL